MEILKIARLSKKSQTGVVRFCNIHLSNKAIDGYLYVSSHTGINQDKLKSSQPIEFRYEHKANEYFEKQILKKKAIGFDHIETKSVFKKTIDINDLSFSYYSYLSKSKFKELTGSCDDLYFKPSPKGERILLQIDAHDGVKAKTLRKTSLDLPSKVSQMLINTINKKMISNCFLDAYFDGRCIFILDVIAIEHELVVLNTLERHTWIKQNLYIKFSKTIKILPYYTSKQFDKNKGMSKAFQTVVLHTYKLNARPVPLKQQSDDKLLWFSCIPKQVKCIVLSTRGGILSLGYTKNGYTKEYMSIPEVNYNFECLDIVSVAICEETLTLIQVIGRLKNSEIFDCPHPKEQLFIKHTTNV